jgi:hypothetical protein
MSASAITNKKRERKKGVWCTTSNKMDRLPQAGNNQGSPQSQIYLYTQNEEEINWSLSSRPRRVCVCSSFGIIVKIRKKKKEEGRNIKR